MINQSNIADEINETIEERIGRHPGYRRAHARGILFKASFVPNGKAAPFTTAETLLEDAEAIVRFSHSSPDPSMTDAASPIKGMAVRLLSQSGPMNLVMATVPVFIAKRPETFHDIMNGLALKDGKIRPLNALNLFIKKPEARAFLRILQNSRLPESFATVPYHAIHAFWLIDESGKRQAVRFRFVPERISYDKPKIIPQEEELKQRVARGPVRFHLQIQLAGENDAVDDPTVEWPNDRPLVEIGTLTLEEEIKEREDLMFDPTLLPTGIEATGDPIFAFRKLVYEESMRRRLQEGKTNQHAE